MIIVDFNQVMLSNLMVSLGPHTNAKIEENMLRHMVLNSLRSYKVKFGHQYGEMIIACDNQNYWRKKIFPYYKANRKKIIEESELNWKEIFDFMHRFRAEIKEFFPYRVLDVPSAEADDIIAALVMEFGTILNTCEDTILILSGDKDFIQLQLYNNVKQYDPVKKRWITHDNPVLYLQEHILKGDKGDGIPNVLCDDDYYVNGSRQRNLTKKRLDLYLSDPNCLRGTYARNLFRNKTLIDLSCVPSYIRENILHQYHSQSPKDRKKLMGYFIEHKLRNLLEDISQF